jgi:hypothetical protein
MALSRNRLVVRWISRTEYVQFLLDKKTRFVAYGLFHIPRYATLPANDASPTAVRNVVGRSIASITPSGPCPLVYSSKRSCAGSRPECIAKLAPQACASDSFA